jgi:hypothetical protein
MDSGGGGGQPQTNVTQSTIPEYAKPYMERLMGKAEALTSSPYIPYQGERIAGFTPLQQQAFSSAASMDAGPAGFAAAVPQYMDPYQQAVTDIRKREATRTSDIQGQQQQAQAAQAGAFGGYREAIQRAERERNLGTQLDDIQAKGSQEAFKQASDQFRQGIAQGMDVNKLQSALGGQQQGVQQQFLSQQYQDFVNQQNQPYKQLGFMSDILRGVPGVQSASQIYTPPPSTTAQLAGLGTLAYGLSKKKGGVIPSADVTDVVPKQKKGKKAGLAELALSRI